MADTASSNGQYETKWRHFHPQSTVWVQNPLDDDVVYQVADERNVQYQYRLPSHKVSELPGGTVATLGVKQIVDQLIQDSGKDALSLYDPVVRKRYEDNVIMRIKEAPTRNSSVQSGGEINLSVDDSSVLSEETSEAMAPVEEDFPELDRTAAENEVSNIASDSLAGKKDTILEDA